LSSLVTTGSIPVGSLITTGIPAGQLRFAGTFGPGVANWYTSQTIINDLVNGAIPTDLLSPAPGATTRSKFLTGRIGDTFAGWRFLEPNVDILNDTLSGGKLQNGTVAPIKVESSGIPDGYLLSKVGGVPDWVAPTAVAGSVTQFVTDIPTTLTQNIPTYTNPVTLAHTLGAVPLSFRVSLYCQTNDGNYIVGEEIDAAALNQGNAGDWWVPFNFQVTNAAVIVGRFDNAHNILITNKTGANHSINLGRWRLRLYAMKVN
jgi:hypothetical protein